MKTLNQLIDFATVLPKKTIAVACPEDYEVLEAILTAYQMHLCNFHLFGNENLIMQMIKENKLSLPDEIKIFHAEDKVDACRKAVQAVSSGKANVVMKGLVDTSIILKEVLNRDYGLRSDSILSHVMLIELPKLKRVILMSDGAMNIDPDVNQLKQITINAINLSKSIGFQNPKVALLSAVEVPNPKIPSTIKCQAIQELYEKGEISDCVLAGPYALDLAISREAAKIKEINHPVAGNADILIVPYIEVGNALYKGWVFGTDNVQNAGIVVGAKAPIILTSRADNHQAKLFSIALSLLIN